MFGFYKIFVNTFFYSLGIFFISVSIYRAAAGVEYILYFLYFLSFIVIVSFYRVAAWVKEPVCIFPVEKIALWKLLAPCHLENDSIGDEDHDYGDDNIVDQDQDHVEIPSSLSPWEQW